MAHVADAGAGFMRVGVAEDLDRSVGGLQESGQNAQQSGLAGAVFTDEDVTATRFEVN